MLQPVGLGELGDIALNAVDGLTGGFAARDAAGSKLLDRGADPVDRARPDPAVDLHQLRLALLNQLRIKGPAFGGQARGFVEQADLADLMSADHEVAPVGQREVAKLGQPADQARLRRQALLQGGQPHEGGCGHAPFGPDQPDANPRFCHR